MIKIEKRHINGSVAALILLTNLFFIKQTIEILVTGGGAMGHGLLLLPITLSINLLIITAILVFQKKIKNSSGLLIFNTFGLIWLGFWLITFLKSG